MSSARGPAIIDRLHDLLSPAHRVGDCADRRRNSFSAVKLGEFACCEDTRGNQENAFAAFVHAEESSIFAFCSPIRAG